MRNFFIRILSWLLMRLVKKDEINKYDLRFQRLYKEEADFLLASNVAERFADRIRSVPYIEKVLPHQEWYFETIQAVVALIDHDTFPATKVWPQKNIVDRDWVKSTVNEMTHHLLVIRSHYKATKQYGPSDMIRKRLIALGVDIKDGKEFVSWELPAFASGYGWLKMPSEIYRERMIEEESTKGSIDGLGI